MESDSSGLKNARVDNVRIKEMMREAWGYEEPEKGTEEELIESVWALGVINHMKAEIDGSEEKPIVLHAHGIKAARAYTVALFKSIRWPDGSPINMVIEDHTPRGCVRWKSKE